MSLAGKRLKRDEKYGLHYDYDFEESRLIGLNRWEQAIVV
jgi:hypothetical protein